MNITPKNNLAKFESFLLDNPVLNGFQYKFLNTYLEDTLAGNKSVYDTSLINISQNGWILVLHGNQIERDYFHIYGDNWNEGQFSEIQESLGINSLCECFVAGESNLVKRLVEFYKKDLQVQKERVFYRTQKVEKFVNSDLSIGLGDEINLKELAIMMQQYYHEEYNGLNDKPLIKMEENILNLIRTKKIFVSKNLSNEIVGFCTIINPEIGILFTKTEYRNNGYGKHLLSECSLKLIDNNNEIFLMTDKEKDSSNKVVSNVGFKPFYEYVMGWID